MKADTVPAWVRPVSSPWRSIGTPLASSRVASRLRLTRARSARISGSERCCSSLIGFFTCLLGVSHEKMEVISSREVRIDTRKQTEVTLDLAPGEHTLQLVLGDAFHVPHDPPVVSDVITVTVN